MIHLNKKSNNSVGTEQILEKRVKKVEKGLEQTNKEVENLKDTVMMIINPMNELGK